MVHLIFSVYDSKAAAYLPPFIIPTQDMASRTFGDALLAKDHQFSRNPADYTLFRLGNFDDSSAEIILEPAPVNVYNGLELKSSLETKDDGPQPLSDETPIQPGTES